MAGVAAPFPVARPPWRNGQQPRDPGRRAWRPAPVAARYPFGPRPGQTGGMVVAAGWFFLRTELRRRWRSWLLLAVIVGVFAGAVQAAVAGARRTDAAYPSLIAWSHAPDVLLFSAPGPSRRTRPADRKSDSSGAGRN